jgi:hypothetical protein
VWTTGEQSLRSPLTIIILLLFTQTVYSQYTNRQEYSIKPVRIDELAKRCGETAGSLKGLPPEVQFATRVIGDTAYLVFDDVRYFPNFFKSKKDGFALDIVHQDQYKCDNIQRLSGSPTHKGILLEPVYREDIQKRMQIRDRNMVYVFGGLVPRSFDKSKIEVNYMLLEDQYQCAYTAVVHVDSRAWDLLPMGLYYDTLYRSTVEERYRDLSKKLRFTIPFEKNKSVYRKEDIKPLYDSLKLTDYAITDIKIRAFTSVEGTLKRNIELQDQRAQSIVDAMQTFQPESIKSEISSNENWVEFLDAIEKSPYKYMVSMSKDEIKEALKDPTVAEKLEPTLAKERKAIIELELEKRVTYGKSTAAELKSYFAQSIAKKNIEEALYLQEIIFRKIEHQELPIAFLTELEVPRAVEFGSLLMNRVTFEFEHDTRTVAEALNAFVELNKLLGGNPKVSYNIAALQLKAWPKPTPLPTGVELKAKIESLKKEGIPEALVFRLLINYHIIAAEMNYAQGNYPEREKSITYIFQTYKRIKLNDADMLSLARFFSYNSRFPQSRTMLEPRIKALDASEDLLFYYINLTMYDRKRTASSGYRAFLLNVVNSNKGRFCHLFDPVPQGGISFQVLEDPFLKKTWCENCNLTP